MNPEFNKMVEKWKRKAYRYYTEAETEKDPIGKKFYEASAQTLFNCLCDLEDSLKIKLLNH